MRQKAALVTILQLFLMVIQKLQLSVLSNEIYFFKIRCFKTVTIDHNFKFLSSGKASTLLTFRAKKLLK